MLGRTVSDKDFVEARNVGMLSKIPNLLDFVLSDLPIFIYGETGTGKSFAASCIHKWSRRRDGPYTEIFGSASTDELVESELFGYVKGAFTGAIGSKPGLISAANG